ncbi:MAG: tetratricopeptide repeat protein [Acidobacteriota bacterium]
MSGAQQSAGSDECFRMGLAALERRTYQEAIVQFRAAIDEERREGTKSPRMKFVSYLGLALTLASGRSEEGARLCQQAVQREFFDPDLYCNLGIVHLRNRRKAQAFEAFRRGLSLSPGHRRIRDELDRYDKRGEPMFSFLPRSHPVNRLFGRMRHRLVSLFVRDGSNGF